MILILQILAMSATSLLSKNTLLLVVGDAICSFAKWAHLLLDSDTRSSGSQDFSTSVVEWLSVPVYKCIIAGLIIGKDYSLRPGLSQPSPKSVFTLSLSLHPS